MIQSFFWRCRSLRRLEGLDGPGVSYETINEMPFSHPLFLPSLTVLPREFATMQETKTHLSWCRWTRSKTATLVSPRASRCSTMCRPTNPQPPMTRLEQSNETCQPEYICRCI